MNAPSWLWCSAKLAAISRLDLPLIPPGPVHRTLYLRWQKRWWGFIVPATFVPSSSASFASSRSRPFGRFPPGISRTAALLSVSAESGRHCGTLGQIHHEVGMSATARKRRADGVKTRVNIIKILTLSLQTSPGLSV